MEDDSAAGNQVAGRGLKANHDFMRLFAAQATSLVGSGVTSVALAAFAYRLTGRDATVVVGTALTLRILAYVTLSPLAGVLADRVNRKSMLVVADVLRVALLGLFPFVSTVAQIYALIFAINAVTAFFTPTFEAAIPELVGARLYTRAIALSRITLALEAAVGPMLAGVVIAAVGLRWTFWVDAATYALSAALVLASRVPRAPRQPGPFPWRELGTQVTHGTRLLLREPALRKALLLHFAEAAAGAVAIVSTVAYVHQVLRRGDVAFALVMAAVGVGSSAAALLLPAREQRARRASGGGADEHLRFHGWAERSLLLGGAVLAGSLLPGVLAPGVALLALLWALNGAGQSLIAIPSVGLLAEHTAPHERGRAYAAHFALTHFFWLLTYPAAGYLSRALGTPRTFSLAGIFCAGLTLLALLIGRGRHRAHPALQVEAG